MKKWFIKRKSVAGLGFALAVLVAISIDAYQNLLNFKQANNWVEHTLKVQNSLEQLLSLLKDAESGQRGYLLTGDARYLTPYENAKKLIQPELKSLRQLTANHPNQQRRIDGVEKLIDLKLAELRQTINLRKTKGIESALQLVRTNQGKQLMDDIRDSLAEMKAAENQLLKMRSDAANASAQRTTFIIIFGSILACGLVGFAIYILNGDIAKRVEFEKQIQNLNDELEQRIIDRTKELEKASTAKDDFLSVLSHELRNPLNAMLGWAKLLRRGNLDAEKTERALETIERNAMNQAQLIEDILDISRIITGKFRLNVRSIELVPIIEAAIDTMMPAADAKSIRIQSILDPAAGPISGDSDRLQQVVWNLLSNAIKFNPKGGRVQVKLQRINSHVEIIISDTGKGISAEFLPYIFARFSQSDSSTTRTQGGLGLGLALVRHIVELHGGTVRADSPGEGQGSTFTVDLPLIILHKKLDDPQRVHPTVGGEVQFDSAVSLEGLNILVVDDEADARVLMTAILGQYGANVTSAGSANDAIALLRQSPTDLLVSDIGMPEQDGYSLIRQVRERGIKIPAIALTAYARVEDRILALSAGFQMHIAKPIETAELVAAIANLTGRNVNS